MKLINRQLMLWLLLAIVSKLKIKLANIAVSEILLHLVYVSINGMVSQEFFFVFSAVDVIKTERVCHFTC